MQFTVSQLLENFAENEQVTVEALEKKLGIADNPQEIKHLQIALDALEKIGILAKDEGGYRRVPEEGLIETRLRCSSKGFCFAIQETEGAEDIYIHESRLNGAWNGDRVLVKVTKDGARRRSPEGEVRLILERANSTLLAKVKSTETGYRGIPLDDRLFFEVELVPTEEVPDLAIANERLVHVQIIRYPLGSHPPLGKILQILGESAETTNDIDLICCKYNLPRRFGVKEMSEAASLPRGVRKSDLKHRLDLREMLTVRIGNAPALSLRQTAMGWELGVHIPDVSAYVSPESVMFSTAQERGRTFYLGETLLPMLPEIGVLSQPEHLAMSLLIQLDQDGNVLSYEIYPSAITVRASLSYRRAQYCIDQGLAQAQAVELDDAAINQKIDPEVYALLVRLNQMGSLLDQHQPCIFLSDQEPLEPDDGVWGIPVLPKGVAIAKVVSDICLLANRLIAEHLHALQLPLPYVVQSAPDANKLADWGKLLSIVAGCDEGDAILQNWQTHLSKLPPATQDIFIYLLWKMWRLGEYSATPGLHYGAGKSAYTHGILPQHRFGDLLIQHLLHMVFETARDRRSSRSKEGVNLHSSTCHGQVNWSVLQPETEKQWLAILSRALPILNQQNNLHLRVINDLEGLRKAAAMRSLVGQNFYGLITGVQSYGFFVQLEQFLVEGLVHVSSLKDDWYEFPPANGKGKPRANNLLVGRRSGRQYALGDRIEVQIRGVDYYRQQIDLTTVIADSLDNLPQDATVELPPTVDEG
jgi:ribonuclease R